MRRLIPKLRQFLSGNAGAAAVEFALILPAMLILYIGANEASALITVDRRVQSVSGTLGDLVARSDTTISSDTMKEYLAAAGGVMTPFPTTDLKQYVTQVKVDADGKTARVVWAKQYINGVYSTNTARPVNSVYALKSASSTTSAMAEIAKGNYVIVAEATTSYLPFYGIVINKPVTLYRENFFMPRFGGSISTP